MSVRTVVVASLVMVAGTPSAALANDMSLRDRTFSGDGVAVPRDAESSLGREGDVAVDGSGATLYVTAQVDGGGRTGGCGGEKIFERRSHVYRYDRAGRPIRSFGRSGRATFDWGATELALSKVTPLSNGQILVAGTVQRNAAINVVVMRLRPGGAIDHSFGRRGRVFIDAGPCDALTGMAIDRAGRILLTGTTRDRPDTNLGAGSSSLWVTRLRPGGSRDASFNRGRLVRFGLSRWDESVGTPTLTSTGRIRMAGTVRLSGTARYGGLMIGLMPDGRRDTSFGRFGVARPAIPDMHVTRGESLAIDGHGRLVVAGWFSPDNRASGWYVQRFRASGRLDLSFGRRGIVRATSRDLGASWSMLVGVDVLPGDRVLATGSSWSADGRGAGCVLVRRLGSGGQPDRSFGGDGEVCVFGILGGRATSSALGLHRRLTVSSVSADYPYMQGILRIVLPR